MSINESPIERFSQAFSQICEIMNKPQSVLGDGLRPAERKALSEASIFLNKFNRATTLSPEYRKYIEQWLDEINGILSQNLYSDAGAFWGAFFYFNTNFSKNSYSALAVTESIVLSITAQEYAGFAINWDESIINDCPNHIQKMFEYFVSVVRSSSDNIGLYFLLLNIIEMLGVITDRAKFNDLYEQAKGIAEYLQREFSAAYDKSPGLRILSHTIKEKHSLKLPNPPKLDSTSTHADLFLCLNELEQGINTVIPPKNHRDAIRRPYLWWIADAWFRLLSGEEDLGLLPFFRRVDINEIANLVWKDLSSLTSMAAPTQNDLEKVRGFSDKEIKNHLYQYFYNHTKITPQSKLRLESERNKTHGPGEIADFNVEFQIPDKAVMICIPIKSAKEAGSTEIHKIALNNIHQIIRPALSFGLEKVIVFALILGEKTLNTTEFLTQFRRQSYIPLEVFDIHFFCRLLKREGYI